MRSRIVCCIAVMAVACMMSFLVSVTSANPDIGPQLRVVSLQGLVSVQLPGERWAPAFVDMTLDSQAVVRTSAESYCDIAIDGTSKNIISIGPETEVTVRSARRMHIAKGRVFASLQELPIGSQFEVATPVAIAGVRGTQWESFVADTAKFSVVEGAVNVAGIDKEGNMTGQNDVPAGNALAVDESGWLSELVELTKEDVKRLKEWSSRINMSLAKRDCDDLIDRSSANPSLFAEVLECDARNQGAFAAALGPEGSVVIRDGGETGGITGGDITTTTFPPPQPEPPEQECSNTNPC